MRRVLVIAAVYFGSAVAIGLAVGVVRFVLGELS